LNRLFVIPIACAAILSTSSVANADQVAVGSTAELLDKQTGSTYRGILVAQNELAPCGATSKAQDIHFAPPRYAVTASPRPCPGLPQILGAPARQAYLKGEASLMDVYQTTAPLPTSPP
jgi:hypothetical protein